jgi:L-fuconolactonase
VTERVDAHHHVWDLAVRDQPWMAGDLMAPIARTFGIDEFIEQAQASSIAAGVVVQAVTEIAETEELLDLAAATTSVVGVVGWVDLAAADVGDQLDQLLARPSGRWLVAIRSLVQYEPDPAWLERPAVRAGMGEVAKRDLVNEVLVVPHQIGAVVDAVSALPESRFVLDHLAKPLIATASWEPWATELADLAARENVCAKISGLATEADWKGWKPDDVRPYLDHALSVFGSGRLLFGSDWPVCTLAATYREVVELAEGLVADLSAGEQAAIFGGNAADVYALNDASREAR